MKKKGIVVITIIAFAILGYGTFQYYSQPDGSTVESREKILRATPKGIKWNIAQEQKFDDYIFSGIYSDSKAGIAVFEAWGKKRYELVSRRWRNADEIIISGYVIDGEWYDIVWFHGAVTSYAEITYTVNGKKEKPIVFDTSDMKIICTKAPSTAYSLEVKYYDDDGNVYE